MSVTKLKTIKTELDNLPDGTEADVTNPVKAKKVPIPQGISKRNLIRDVILIALPSLLELLLTQLTSMADQVMVGRLPGVEGIIALSAVGLANCDVCIDKVVLSLDVCDLLFEVLVGCHLVCPPFLLLYTYYHNKLHISSHFAII